MVAELQGFTVLTEEAAKRMDRLDLDAARFRGVCQKVFEHYIEEASRLHRPVEVATAGGDTWVLAFDALEEAISFGVLLMRLCASAVLDHGMGFLKPALTLALGRPKSADGRIIDNQSILAYRQSDHGHPFEFVIHQTALAEVSRLGNVDLIRFGEEGKTKPEQPRDAVDWRRGNAGSIASLPTISSTLLDGDVVFSATAAKGLENLVAHQARATEILAFGGPIAFDHSTQNSYVRETIRLLRTSDKRWTILSYLPMAEPVNSLAWLELCRRLQKEFPKRFTAAAFVLHSHQLRPFSYQVFDAAAVHVGLRQYSPQTGTPTMSGAILFRNKAIAQRFRDEFLESFRSFGALDNPSLKRLVAALDVDLDGQQTAYKMVDNLMA